MSHLLGRPPPNVPRVHCPQGTHEVSGITPSIRNRDLSQAACASKMRFVVVKETADHTAIGWWSIHLEHLEQAPESSANTCDAARAGLRTPASREVLPDEAIDGGVVDRPVPDPTAEVLDCEHVLVELAWSVTSGLEISDVVLEDDSQRIRLDARPNGRATKDGVEHGRHSSPDTRGGSQQALRRFLQGL